MGMFDKEQGLTSQDDFDTSQPFELVSAEYLGKVKHADYGENQKARVLVRGVGESGDGAPYVVFGVMADQIQRMDDDDLPAIVIVAKDGRANVFARADA